MKRSKILNDNNQYRNFVYRNTPAFCLVYGVHPLTQITSSEVLDSLLVNCDLEIYVKLCEFRGDTINKINTQQTANWKRNIYRLNLTSMTFNPRYYSWLYNLKFRSCLFSSNKHLYQMHMQHNMWSVWKKNG